MLVGAAEGTVEGHSIGRIEYLLEAARMKGVLRNVIALTVAGVGSLAVLGTAVTAAPDVSGWKTYRNLKIGLEFRYPADAVPKELTTPDGRPIAIGLKAGNWYVSARVDELIYGTEAVRPEDTAAVLRVATDLAQGQCAADGPDSSVSCPTVLKTERFTTASGRAGLELYLAEESVSYGGEGEPDKTETRTKGPIYAVDVSTSATPRVLLFTPADGSRSREHREILRAIVDTVRVSKVP